METAVENRDRLFESLYRELHRAAQRELQRNSQMTLSPTTLLHETYLSMSGGNGAALGGRAQFMAYAARAMRGVLIDYLRSRQAQKRGGQFEITALPTELPRTDEDAEVEKLAVALDALAKVDERLAHCVDLKFFCGYSFAEIAELWSVSERTVQRDWDKARVLLHRLVSDQPLA
ncbi:MAG TPA: ECF-type sigma factor [Steroidobacteraceae bacterium]|nr:ECF-type sigma factor [Steroidobacteraceae bacterium]